MAVVLPAKGSVEKYAVAELRRFVFEIGRTFGIVQYEKEHSLVECVMCARLSEDCRCVHHRLDTPRAKEARECPENSLWATENTDGSS